MKYFAYGSNMSIPRIQSRIPGAKKLPGVFSLAGHILKFHKPSKRDGSGKCDAHCTGNENDKVLGVIYEINYDEKNRLDKCESGYKCKEVSVRGETGDCTAFTYYAANTQKGLRPYCGYKNHVLAGAEEAGFPAEYIAEFIKSVEASPDPEKQGRA